MRAARKERAKLFDAMAAVLHNSHPMSFDLSSVDLPALQSRITELRRYL
jgi:hypothetical protein